MSRSSTALPQGSRPAAVQPPDLEASPIQRPAFVVIDHVVELIDELRALKSDEVGLAGDVPAISYAIQALKRLHEAAAWRQRKLRDVGIVGG